MRSVNKVILIGNLTRDPEVRQTPNGQSVTTFGIATNRDWVTRDGQHHTSSEYHEIVAWSHLAEICGKYLKKGKLVYIEGYLKTRSWDTPEGVKKFKTEIVIQDMIMLEKRQSNGTEEYIPEEGVQEQNGMAMDTSGSAPAPHASAHAKSHEHTEETHAPAPKPAHKEHKEPVAAGVSAAKESPSAPINIDDDLGL